VGLGLGFPHVKRMVPEEMTTAVRWAEQVTKSFYLPSSESILRIVTR
jgi:hypothetical protein